MRWPIARDGVARRRAAPRRSRPRARRPAANDTAQLVLRGFASERKTEVLLQASAAVVGILLPVIAVIFYLAVSVICLIEPFREVDIHAPRAAPPGKP